MGLCLFEDLQRHLGGLALVGLQGEVGVPWDVDPVDDEESVLERDELGVRDSVVR